MRAMPWRRRRYTGSEGMIIPSPFPNARKLLAPPFTSSGAGAAAAPPTEPEDRRRHPARCPDLSFPEWHSRHLRQSQPALHDAGIEVTFSRAHQAKTITLRRRQHATQNLQSSPQPTEPRELTPPPISPPHCPTCDAPHQPQRASATSASSAPSGLDCFFIRTSPRIASPRYLCSLCARRF